MKPFQLLVELGVQGGHADFLNFSKNRVLANWISNAYNSRGGAGPWGVQDILDGNPRFGVRGVGDRIDQLGAESALDRYAKKGLVKLSKIGGGIIDKFWITVD